MVRSFRRSSWSPGMLPGELPVPLEMGLDPGHQFPGAEGLDDVVIGSQTQTPDFVHVLLSGGYQQDGDVPLFPDLPADLESVHPRQHNVQEHQVHFFIQGRLFSGQAVSGNGHRKSVGFQIIPFQFGNIQVIFHDQDFFHCSGPPPKEMSCRFSVHGVGWLPPGWSPSWWW